MTYEQTNSVLSRRAKSISASVDTDFAVYEQLPPVLRYAVRELAQPVLALDVVKVLRQRGMTFTLWALGEQERREIGKFAQDYYEQTGQAYPFLEAGATVQRYAGQGRGINGKQRRTHMRFDLDLMTVPNTPRQRRRKQ